MNEQQIQEVERNAVEGLRTIGSGYDIMKDTLLHLSITKGVNYQTAAADALTRVNALEDDARHVAVQALGEFDALLNPSDDDMDEPLGERQEDADGEECTSCQ